MTALFPLDRAAFVAVRCSVCRSAGPASALDAPADPLHSAARRHLADVHPGAPETSFTIEPARAAQGWDGTEPPHEWYTRVFPPAW
ncbi:hypothetical protein ACFU8I_09375 [Streptomyces sp. NPDC057540]|uniref:hypothetical protein n=1 Tax=Streptomyces sp. NPDC057540 TaxID=3346160 RepID=UPI003686F7E4